MMINGIIIDPIINNIEINKTDINTHIFHKITVWSSLGMYFENIINTVAQKTDETVIINE